MADRAHRAPRPQTTSSAAGPRKRAPENDILKLQRQVGNRAVAAYVNALAVQREKEGDGPSNAVGIIQQQLNAVGASPRLAVTGRFDAATTTAAKAFQKKLIAEGHPVTENGIVDGLTKAQLTLRAPSVKISDTDTVVVGPGNALGALTDPAKGTHKQLQIGAKGIAVKELQERLNSSGAVTGKKLKVDGDFRGLTDKALKDFQTGAKLTANGIADPATWAKLETAGAASQGHVEYDWTEEVEGVKGIAGRASYDWKLSKKALDITVGITFVKKHKNVDGRISQWLDDIKQIWSTFRAVNLSDPVGRRRGPQLRSEARREGPHGQRVPVRPDDAQGGAKPRAGKLDDLVHHRHQTRDGPARVRPPDRAGR